jgi:hypothetical protein
VDNQRRGVCGIGTRLRKLGRLRTQKLLQDRRIVGERIIGAHRAMMESQSIALVTAADHTIDSQGRD